MPFSDDYAPTFSNDESGDFLDAPDVVRQSPTTSERVVDTQSGFLVVIKRVDSRFSLSVKRRIGTPPASSILLTPDESIKLSKILGSAHAEYRTSSRVSSRPSSDLEGWLEKVESRQNQLQSQNLDVSDRTDELDSDLDLDDSEPGRSRDNHSRPYQGRRPRSARKPVESGKLPLKLIGIVAACLIILPIAAFGGYQLITARHSAPQQVEAPKPAVDVAAVETERVNKFARNFVSDMLDFNPTTYRVSQIHAMANMAPELLDNYWKETHFPLSAAQLKALTQGTTLMITKVDQERLDESLRTVDIYAELVSPDSKLSNPVHLQLKIENTADGQLRVLEQKDLTTKK